MNGPIFQGLYYHIQLRGMDDALLRETRNKLEVSPSFSARPKPDEQGNGARYCVDPCHPQCQIVVVDPPRKTKRIVYVPMVTIPRYEQLKHHGGWTYDTLCFHFGQRRDIATDRHQEVRKTVVAVGWVDECLRNGGALMDGNYVGWEVK